VPSVLIVGAGYAGVHAAATARSHGANVTILDPVGQHELLPRLAAVAAGRRAAGDAWAPIGDLTGAEWIRGRAVRVDPHAAAVHLLDGRTLLADAVVVTVGGAPSLPPVPGIDQAHARTLSRASDALLLRDELADAAALVVVGGGATGVQLAAETARRHPALTVHLVESSAGLLPAYAARLGHHAARVLADRGVEVRTGTSVTSADERGVVLDDGTRHDGVVVWATGSRADAGALLSGIVTQDGRAVVDNQLRVGARVLVAGDVALHRDVLGNVVAPSAQVAVQAGRAAGANAARIAAGRRARPVALLDLGWVVDLGGGHGVASIGPVPLAAPVLDLLPPLFHELVDARHLLQAGGVRALARHAPGRHRPGAAALRRAERPGLRSVV
jgi:NADH dehydrogenase